MQLDFEAEELATRRRYYREALKARQSGRGKGLGVGGQPDRTSDMPLGT